MTAKYSTNEENFWIDDPSISGIPSSSLQRSFSLFGKLTVIYLVLFSIGIPIALFATLSPTLAWIWVIIVSLTLSLYVSRSRKLGITRKNALLIQSKARDLTGASTINSAIHVAGHPFLDRDQPIVLALVDNRLEIFGYESSRSIDSINLADIISLNTVVYDDERVPHIEVIDSAAQALQFTFSKNGKPITCLFRQMGQVRPIDWYHDIEKARYSTN
jgi:hypothetical protein